MLLKMCCYVITLLIIICAIANYMPAFATNSEQTNEYSHHNNNVLKGKLIFAHVLYRHGDRTPIEPYPTDPWNKVEFWPTGWGQLTNTGKLQHFQLGHWLRQRYNTILSSNYTKDEIYVCATDVDRTLMSALSNLAGLYPPTSTQVWNKDIAWQPIPVHTVPEHLDVILGGKAPCPAYDYALSALKHSPEFQQINARYTYLFDYLKKYSGHSVNTLEAVQRFNNTLYIEELYNKTLPEWTKKVYPSNDMTFIANFNFATYTYTRQLARLKTGPLLKEILERFDNKTRKRLNPDRSVWVYSAHDTTIASVLNTLKIFDLHSPPYTACILFELRLDAQNQPFVSVFYKNSTADPLLMEIPKCGKACPLTKMFELYKDVLPDDWASECKLSTLMMTYEDADIGLAMGILVAIITVMLFLSYIILIYFRHHSYKTYTSYSQVA